MIVKFTFGTDGDQFDPLARDKIQRLIDVGDFVEPHLAPVRLGKRLARYDLEEQHELQAVPEVLFDVLDLRSGLAKMGVDPSGEGLMKETWIFISEMDLSWVGFIRA